MKAIDLVDKIFELKAMTPEIDDWDREKLVDNPPRFVRLKRVESLLKAFKLDGSGSIKTNILIKSFLSGDFIKERPIEVYEEAVDFMEKYTAKNSGFINKRRVARSWDLAVTFERLISYKEVTRKLLKFNSDLLEAGTIGLNFSITLTNSISEKVRDYLSDIDKVLELLINPGGLSFTEEELETLYSYPTENLYEIDDDWM